MPPKKGNKNAVGHIPPTKGKQGYAMMVSLPYEEWEAFKAAADLSEGSSLSEDEYKELWRGLCRGAVAAFIKQHHGYEDPAIIL